MPVYHRRQRQGTALDPGLEATMDADDPYGPVKWALRLASGWRGRKSEDRRRVIEERSQADILNLLSSSLPVL